MKGTTAQLRARIERLIKKWLPILDLESWMLNVRFDERTSKGTCLADPRYEEGTVGFNLPRILNEIVNIGELEELVVHELVHCIIWKSSERAVTQVTRSLLRARGIKYID